MFLFNWGQQRKRSHGGGAGGRGRGGGRGGRGSGRGRARGGKVEGNLQLNDAEKVEVFEYDRNDKNAAFKYDVYRIVKSGLAAASGGSFAVGELLKDAPLIGIDVKGVGKFSFPLYERPAKDLIAACQQSPYGKKELTVVDTNVRRSWELDPKAFKILNADWDKCLKTVLATVGKGLGIDAKIKGTLYKLLVYEAGSHFKPHRDTEKEENMFGTLVIQLPSEYEGGELVVNHDSKTKRFDYSTKKKPPSAVKTSFATYFAAFYCDCEHEILPLTSGYRTCLIYNLTTIDSGEVPKAKPTGDAEGELVKALTDWPEGPEPDKFVYVLEHKYTPAGLSFKNLKLNDKIVAQLIRGAAAATGQMHVYLCQLTKHEEGSLDSEADAYYECGYGRKEHWGWHEDADIEVDYCLENWRSTNDEKVELGNWDLVDEFELIPPNVFAGVPDKEKAYYTGNAGTEAQRWYTRAALVVWPEKNTRKLKLSDTAKVELGKVMKPSTLAKQSDVNSCDPGPSTSNA